MIKVLSAQSSVLLNVSLLRERRTWAVAFFKMVAKRWVFLAESQKFKLSTPKYWAPTILEAATKETYTLSDCAKLLLTVGDAINAKWPADMLTSLRALV